MAGKTPHQVSPKGLGQDHLLLQFLLDVLSREHHALGERNRAGLVGSLRDQTTSDLSQRPCPALKTQAVGACGYFFGFILNCFFQVRKWKSRGRFA